MSESAWPGSVPVQPPNQPRHTTQALFALHVCLYGLTMLTLLAINLTTGQEHLWFLWPAWGWGIVLAAHAGSLWSSHRLLGADLLASLTIMLGLSTIDRQFSTSSWAYWPALGLGLPLLWYGLVSLNVTNPFGAHVVTYLAGNLALLAIYLTRSDHDRWYLWVLSTWTSLLLIHGLAHRRIIGPFGIHALLFLTCGAMLIAADLLRNNNEFHWNVLILPPWALVLTAHALIRFHLVTGKAANGSPPR